MDWIPTCVASVNPSRRAMPLIQTGYCTMGVASFGNQSAWWICAADVRPRVFRRCFGLALEVAGCRILRHGRSLWVAGHDLRQCGARGWSAELWGRSRSCRLAFYSGDTSQLLGRRSWGIRPATSGFEDRGVERCGKIAGGLSLARSRSALVSVYPCFLLSRGMSDSGR